MKRTLLLSATVVVSPLLWESSAWTLPHIRAPTASRPRRCQKTVLESKKQSRSSVDVKTVEKLQEEETPAGIEGAQFFGGNKQKEELYDPNAEAQAGVEEQAIDHLIYRRFEDRAAFTDDAVAALAQDLQNQVNGALYTTSDENGQTTTTTYSSSYAPNLQWDTPFQSNTNSPLQELENSLDFYNRVDLAISAGKTVAANTFELRWELSVVWPTFWEPRVLITGTSQLTLDDSNRVIQKQQDTLDDSDLSNTLSRQILPRFWDVYHIGMTPSAEVSPKLPTPATLFAPYKLYKLPPRLYLQPSQLDTGDRDDGNAATIPNHSFSCVIKTMGPTRQRYDTAVPVQVQLQALSDGSRRLEWRIPIAVEYLSAPTLTLPGDNPEAEADTFPVCAYVWQPARRVATLPFGGHPQDADVAAVRERLYDSVVQHGLVPQLDDRGRPKFFFWQNAVKACYTEEGLGMAVYEWRPALVRSNEVGIELQLDDEEAALLKQ